jgi:hypothetical protein
LPDAALVSVVDDDAEGSVPMAEGEMDLGRGCEPTGNGDQFTHRPLGGVDQRAEPVRDQHGTGRRRAIAGDLRDTYLTDTRDALRTLIQDIKAGKADHLL